MAKPLTVASRIAALSALALSLAACGATPSGVSAPLSARATGVRALDDCDAKMDAIAKSVLAGQFTALAANGGTNAAGAVVLASYKASHSATATTLLAQFDANHDGVVTADEYNAGLANPAIVTSYHHAAEAQMAADQKPFVTAGKLPLNQLRPYMVTIGLMGDWPLIGKLSTQLDLNQDGKFMSNKAETQAFMLAFAQPTLEHALGLSVTQFSLLARR